MHHRELRRHKQSKANLHGAVFFGWAFPFSLFCHCFLTIKEEERSYSRAHNNRQPRSTWKLKTTIRDSRTHQTFYSISILPRIWMGHIRRTGVCTMRNPGISSPSPPPPTGHYVGPLTHILGSYILITSVLGLF